MKIVLKKDVSYSRLFGTGSGSGNVKTYKAGESVEVSPADNLPESSRIKFWIIQDGWDDDFVGFGLYSEDFI